MKIISLYYMHKPGGLCTRLYRALNALHSAGHEVYYLSLDPPPDSLSSGVRRIKIPFPMKARSGALFWIVFTTWVPLFTLLTALRVRPDKFVVFGAYYSTMSWFAAKAIGRPIVLFVRSLVFRINRLTKKPLIQSTVFDLLEKIGLRVASKVICMTESMQLELQEFARAPIRFGDLLPNNLPASNSGLDRSEAKRRIMALFPGKIEDDTCIILTAGVIDQRKNLNLLLSAISELEEHVKQKIFLLIAGDGPLLNQIKAECAELSLSCVGFLGWYSVMEEVYRASDLLVHPSLHEGMPNTVLEALAADLPILLADTPELREFAKDEQLLFPVESPEGLSKILSRFVSDPDFRVLQKSQARKVASAYRFNWEQRAVQIVAA